MVEASTNHLQDPDWRLVETLTLPPSGGGPTRREATILSLIPRRHVAKSTGRSLGPEGDDEDELTMPGIDPDAIRVRVKLCLQGNHETCGDHTEAESKF